MIAIAEPIPAPARRERFFLFCAFAMAAVIVGGFAFNLAMGRSSFALPAVFHVHAVIFFGWVALYLTQTVLVAMGSVRLHRTLGWASVVWVPAMVIMGIVITVHVTRLDIAPPFFETREFLIGNPFGLFCFAGLVFAAIAMRRRTPWHRRLMLCAMASLTGPGFGRLLPMPFMIPWSWAVAALVMPLIFPIAGMIADRVRSRRVHPAWMWGAGVMVGSFVMAQAIAFSPLGTAVTRAVLAGTPHADRGFAPHFP